MSSRSEYLPFEFASGSSVAVAPSQTHRLHDNQYCSSVSVLAKQKAWREAQKKQKRGLFSRLFA